VIRAAAVALAVAALAGCGGVPAPGPWHDEGGWRWRELPPAGRGGNGFTSLGGRASGLRFVNAVSDSAAIRNRHLMHGSGVAIGDVDGDDLPDVYLARVEGPNALYRNRGGWRFEDVTDRAGVALPAHPSTGAVFADVDGDGDLDLLVTGMGARPVLFLNDGAGRFTDATDAAGLPDEARGGTTAALADVDGDGHLDLYVANYKARTMLDSLSPQARAFDQIVKKTGDRYEVIPALRDHYRVILRDDIRAVSLVQRAEPDWFLRNQGGGRFVRERFAGNPRFRDEAGRLLDREPDDFGLAAPPISTWPTTSRTPTTSG
jgi:enediyne biosynthesis protein E4